MLLPIHSLSLARPLITLTPVFFSPLSAKILILVKSVFNTMQWSFVSLYGFKEILFDRVREIRRGKKNPILIKARKVDLFLNKIFLKKEKITGLRYNLAHGSLYFSSGVFGTAAAAQRAGWIASTAFPLDIAGNGLFAFASFVALVQNVKIYHAASKIPSHAPAHEREAAAKLKVSAFLGIVSSLNYIFAAALLMIGPSAALALIFGCIAVTTGCIKILYDFIRFRNAY